MKNRHFRQFYMYLAILEKIVKNRNFLIFEKLLSRHQTLASWVFRSIFGTWRTNVKTRLRFGATCCKIWLHIVKMIKCAFGEFGHFSYQKSIFLKVADIVRKIDIWPENDIFGILEWFGSLIWYLESSGTNFEKIEKKRSFRFLRD